MRIVADRRAGRLSAEKSRPQRHVQVLREGHFSPFIREASSRTCAFICNRTIPFRK
jgi:hypothetical protein